MSIESVAKALHVRALSMAERIVLVGIANHDGDGGAWPSIATLADYACCSERHVRQVIVQLEAKGLLTRQLRAGGGGNVRADRRPNLYTLHLETGCGGGVDKPRDDRKPSSARTTGTTGTPVPERPEPQFRNDRNPSSAEPSYEPSYEPSSRLHGFTQEHSHSQTVGRPAESLGQQ